MSGDFSLLRPRTVNEAVRLLADGAGVPYCGGTELLPVIRMGLLRPDALIDLKRVRGLAGVADAGEWVTVGAATTHREIAGSGLLRAHAGILCTAAHALGNMRVRATGTVGGNVCFAEPRSDIAAALVALRASAVLRSAHGERTVRVDDFLESAFTTTRRDDELLVEIRLPKDVPPAAYVRFQPAEYPTVSVAVVPPSHSRAGVLVVGAVGERPQRFEVGSLDDVDAEGLSWAVDVVPDLNGAEDYKRHLTAVFVRRALARVRGVADGG
ncbi:MAG: FAD binding domain-containing protein [Nocardioidaceae bacterium]